ncbi:hypothetical protein ACRALDRAFT_208145 [Sodiomyces alcalophilus JCM 7366]|uniref:uncharacterized protein n=1 Tax=Sodiomyces alcalophilus JCM 7366 TaxID=591952 RepID=UPI0039B42636
MEIPIQDIPTTQHEAFPTFTPLSIKVNQSILRRKMNQSIKQRCRYIQNSVYCPYSQVYSFIMEAKAWQPRGATRQSRLEREEEQILTKCSADKEFNGNLADIRVEAVPSWIRSVTGSRVFYPKHHDTKNHADSLVTVIHNIVTHISIIM